MVRNAALHLSFHCLPVMRRDDLKTVKTNRSSKEKREA